MWELYDDDESFQRMARGRGVHDAKLLARVLYGKKTAKKSEKSIKVPTEENKNKGDRKGKHIQFKEVEGRFLIDSSLMSEDDEDDDGIEFLRLKFDKKKSGQKEFRSKRFRYKKFLGPKSLVQKECGLQKLRPPKLCQNIWSKSDQ